MLFYLVVDQTATSTNVSGCCKFFFCRFTLKKYFKLKNPYFLKIQSFLYVLRIHFNCLHSQVNNLNDKEREQTFFYSQSNILEKFKGWLLANWS